jgi:hypothetical protein
LSFENELVSPGEQTSRHQQISTNTCNQKTEPLKRIPHCGNFADGCVVSMTLNKCGMKKYCRFFFVFEFLLCKGISSEQINLEIAAAYDNH